MNKNEIEEIFNHDSNNGGHISLGIDSNNNLYVNRKKVVTTNIIKFDKWVNISIVAGGFSTFGVFIIELFKAIK